MISLLCPSRGRPKKSRETIKNWLDRSTIDVEVILSLDWDDPTRLEYHQMASYILVSGANKSAVDAINGAAEVAKGDIFIVVSDDTDCPDGWDKFLMKLVDGKTDWILKTNDGTQPWIITSPILDRAYYNRFGYIYHPDYRHMFCDTELTCVADLTGRKIISNILFKHNHYSVTKEPPDAISKRADGTWDQGEKLFLERYKRNFDLPPDQIKGKIQDNGMINWLKRKAR